MTTRAQRDNARWDSLVNGYIPGERLDLPDDLPIHDSAAEEIDPITFEVIRMKLWNLNWDHQETLRRTSGSLVVIQSYDFNTSIQTELGEGVVFGPGNLFFAGCADLVVQWTLEHRAGNVGVKPGDIFIQDDPWVGTNHAMDAAVYRPVFVDGKLFSWVYNVTHQRELGGAEPGGFVQGARDVHSESTFWPPVKLGENGAAREDLMEAWIRRSRLPQLMAIELRAQLAGVHVAHDRLLEIVDRYGADVVKGVMRRMITNTADAVGRRLQAIPDGTWTDERYVTGASPTDAGLYRFAMRFEVRGDRLVVSNEGTSAPAGSFNMPRGVFRACVVSSLLHFLAWDQQLCGAGLLRQLDFELADNAINSARHPHAISTSLGLTLTLNQSHHLGAKLVSGTEEGASHAFASSGEHSLLLNQMSGIDQYGAPFASFPFDGTTGAIGAFGWRDGIDHGGTSFSTNNPLGSVEAYEQEVPFLYLYRKERSDSGGHGQWRGGATIVAAWTGHGSDEVYVSSGGMHQSVTQGLGLNGGLPSTGGQMWRAEDTGVLDAFARGEVPSTPEALRELGTGGPPPPKKFDNRMRPGDLFETMPQPGAGFGDPLLRDLDAVGTDLDRGRLSPADAERIYGARIADDGTVDGAASEVLRGEIRAGRLRDARAPRTPRDGAVAAEALVTAAVGAGRGPHGVELVCRSCERVLGAADRGYRSGCCEQEQPLTALGPYFEDPEQQVGETIVLRVYLCPGCAISLDSEVCRPGDPPFEDVVLDADAFVRRFESPG